MGAPSILRSATFTRPADTTAYAAADLVANDVDGGDVVMMSWQIPNSGLWLRRVALTKSGATVTNAQFRLWLHSDSAVTFANGDNGALSVTGLALSEFAQFGVAIDVTIDKGATGLGAVGYATVDAGLHFLGGPASPPASQSYTTIYGFLEARAAYTPESAEVFTAYLRGDPYL